MDTERGVLNTGVYCGEKGRNSRECKDWGGIALGEIPNVDEEAINAANHHNGRCIPM